MARKYTNLILEMNDNCYFNKDELIRDLLCWMSEADVEEFWAKYIGCLYDENQEDEDEDEEDEDVG